MTTPDIPGADMMGAFAQWYAEQQAAAAQDTDPDNDRDVVFSNGDKSITLPWRKAREFDIDSLLESGFGLKRKAAAPAASGGGDDGSSGTGKGKAQAGQAGAAPGAAVTNLFRGKQAGKAS